MYNVFFQTFKAYHFCLCKHTTGLSCVWVTHKKTGPGPVFFHVLFSASIGIDHGQHAQHTAQEHTVLEGKAEQPALFIP